MTASEAIAAVKDVIRRKHLALATERTYTHWLADFFRFLADAKAVPVEPAARMEAYLTMLANRQVAATTQNQAFNALLFFYREVLKTEPGQVQALRAKTPSRLRHAPTVEEVRAVLSALRDSPNYPFRLIGSLLYACGLRVSEPLNFRIKDIDLSANRVIVRGAKGGKDRVISLPLGLRDAMGRQIAAARVVHARAVSQGIPVKLPDQLGTKYPSYGFAFPWFWLFPAPTNCPDPRTGKPVWWRCHEAAIQGAVRRAAQAAGIPGTLTPHHLRHAFATHAVDAGVSVRDVQAVMGHASLETTMIYVHESSDRLISPFDRIGIAV